MESSELLEVKQDDGSDSGSVPGTLNGQYSSESSSLNGE